MDWGAQWTDFYSRFLLIHVSFFILLLFLSTTCKLARSLSGNSSLASRPPIPSMATNGSHITTSITSPQAWEALYTIGTILFCLFIEMCIFHV
jgi:hypothetical protein